MGSKPTLYDMLGVAHGASLPELNAAYRRETSALEAGRATASAQEFNDKTQLLRLALNTLADPVSRLGYDSKLAASSRPPENTALSLALEPQSADRAVASTEVRADALSLRADALALRADAMLVRAGVGLPGAGRGGALHTVASGTMTAFKRFVSALGILVLLGIGAFVATRFMVGDSSGRRAVIEAKAHEKTALQEYFQTHGVRPANMAELELLEADRRRRENQGRQVGQDRDKQEQDARRFEEESRRRAQEASDNLRRSEEQGRHEAEREQNRELAQQRMVLQDKRAREEAEQRRIEREKAQWTDVLRR